MRVDDLAGSDAAPGRGEEVLAEPPYRYPEALMPDVTGAPQGVCEN